MGWLPHTTRAALTGLRNAGSRSIGARRKMSARAPMSSSMARMQRNGEGAPCARRCARVRHETARRPLPEAAAGSVRAETPATATGLEAELAELERLSLDDLRLRWRNNWGRLAPAHLSRGLLLFASWPIAFRLRRSAILIGKPFGCWSEWRMMRRKNWLPTGQRRPVPMSTRNRSLVARAALRAANPEAWGRC